MSEDNVVDISKFSVEKTDVDAMKASDKAKVMLDALDDIDPEHIILMAFNEDGTSRLYHTMPESRLHLVGALETLKHWILTKSIETGVMG